MKDLYKILNINKTSSDNDIKKAYKKLAFQYHPDKNNSSDAESKFREISEAYDILMNTDKEECMIISVMIVFLVIFLK